ncbi:MAG: FecR domain-containing protein [Treponema sp.]|nr:FecR domain-containing protein [Treponema sp.]
MKKKRNTKSTVSGVIVTILCLLGIGIATFLFYKDINISLANENEEPIGVVYFKQNNAQRRLKGRNLWERLKVSSPIYDGDRIRTGEMSEASAVLNDGSTISVHENTLIQIYSNDSNNTLQFINGTISVTSASESEGLKVQAGDKIITFGENTAAVINIPEEIISKGSEKNPEVKKTKSEAVIAVSSGEAKVYEAPKTEELSGVKKLAQKTVSKIDTISGNPKGSIVFENKTKSQAVEEQTVKAGNVAIVSTASIPELSEEQKNQIKENQSKEENKELVEKLPLEVLSPVFSYSISQDSKHKESVLFIWTNYDSVKIDFSFFSSFSEIIETKVLKTSERKAFITLDYARPQDVIYWRAIAENEDFAKTSDYAQGKIVIKEPVKEIEKQVTAVIGSEKADLLVQQIAKTEEQITENIEKVITELPPFEEIVKKDEKASQSLAEIVPEKIILDDFVFDEIEITDKSKLVGASKAEQRISQELKRREEAERLAEIARLEEEARLAELKRKEEEARLAEALRLEEEAKAAEKKRQEELKKIEAAKQAAEKAKKAQEAKLAVEKAKLAAEKARKEEEARIASEKARKAEEEARLAAEAKKKAEEEARKAEIARKLAQEEAERKAEEARKKAEQERIALEKKIAEQKAAEEKAAAELKIKEEKARLEKEAREKEQARLQAQLEEERLAQERKEAEERESEQANNDSILNEEAMDENTFDNAEASDSENETIENESEEYESEENEDTDKETADESDEDSESTETNDIDFKELIVKTIEVSNQLKEEEQNREKEAEIEKTSENSTLKAPFKLTQFNESETLNNKEENAAESTGDSSNVVQSNSLDEKVLLSDANLNVEVENQNKEIDVENNSESNNKSNEENADNTENKEAGESTNSDENLVENKTTAENPKMEDSSTSSENEHNVPASENEVSVEDNKESAEELLTIQLLEQAKLIESQLKAAETARIEAQREQAQKIIQEELEAERKRLAELAAQRREEERRIAEEKRLKEEAAKRIVEERNKKLAAAKQKADEQRKTIEENKKAVEKQKLEEIERKLEEERKNSEKEKRLIEEQKALIAAGRGDEIVEPVICQMKPVLGSPKDNKVFTDEDFIEDDNPSIIFSWKPMETVSSYRFEIRTASGKKLLVKTLKTNRYVLSDKINLIAESGEYEWVVSGKTVINGKTYTSQETVKRFTVKIEDVKATNLKLSDLIMNN